MSLATSLTPSGGSGQHHLQAASEWFDVVKMRRHQGQDFPNQKMLPPCHLRGEVKVLDFLVFSRIMVFAPTRFV
jgi:hypothetical protein